MARPNVTVLIDDQSFIVPGTEAGSITVGGMFSQNGLMQALGTTADVKQGFMRVGSLAELMERLTCKEGFATSGWYGDQPSTSRPAQGAAGATGPRWPAGPTGAWKYEFWAAHNFLQYGGSLVIGATGSESFSAAPTAGANSLHDKSIPLDVVFAATGGVGDANLDYSTVASTIATVREDCVAVVPDTKSGTTVTSAAVPTGAVSNEYTICVFGSKKHLGINRTEQGIDANANLLSTHCAADVAGCIARTDRLSDPWMSPAGFNRGQILDVVRLEYNPSESEMDTLYDAKINPVVTFPGEGTMLFGDKTLKVATSTLSRINVSRLFIYLKKVIGSAARSKLFELNDFETRSSFINAVTPVLNRVKARRGLYDFRVVCDESNNTPNLIDSNQFIADIYIKPAKSINFIKITFTNKNTADDLGNV